MNQETKEKTRAFKKAICEIARKAYSEYELTQFAKGCVDILIKHVETSEDEDLAAEVHYKLFDIFARGVADIVKECNPRAQAR